MPGNEATFILVCVYMYVYYAIKCMAMPARDTAEIFVMGKILAQGQMQQV